LAFCVLETMALFIALSVLSVSLVAECSAHLTETPYNATSSDRRRRTAHMTITLHGLVGGGSQDAILTYPETPFPGHKYPLISFAHGTGAAPRYYQGLMDAVSKEGFIVVAVESCPFARCRNGYLDIVKAIEVCKDGTAHPKGKPGEKVEPLAHADFDSVGIFGHSMGGGYVTAIATDGGHNIKCGASLHGSPCGSYHSEAPRIPMLYTAGSTDRTVPSSIVKRVEATCKAKCKYHEVSGGHFPISSEEADYVAKYLKGCVGSGGSSRRRRTRRRRRRTRRRRSIISV